MTATGPAGGGSRASDSSSIPSRTRPVQGAGHRQHVAGVAVRRGLGGERQRPPGPRQAGGPVGPVDRRRRPQRGDAPCQTRVGGGRSSFTCAPGAVEMALGLGTGPEHVRQAPDEERAQRAVLRRLHGGTVATGRHQVTGEEVAVDGQQPGAVPPRRVRCDPGRLGPQAGRRTVGAAGRLGPGHLAGLGRHRRVVACAAGQAMAHPRRSGARPPLRHGAAPGGARRAGRPAPPHRPGGGRRRGTAPPAAPRAPPCRRRGPRPARWTPRRWPGRFRPPPSRWSAPGGGRAPPGPPPAAGWGCRTRRAGRARGWRTSGARATARRWPGAPGGSSRSRVVTCSGLPPVCSASRSAADAATGAPVRWAAS